MKGYFYMLKTHASSASHLSTSAKNFCTVRCTFHGSPPFRRRPNPASSSSPLPSRPPLLSSPPPTHLSSSSPPPTRQPSSEPAPLAPRGPSYSFPPHPRRSRAARHSRGLLFPTGSLLLPAAVPSPCRRLTARDGGGQRRRHRAVVRRQECAPSVPDTGHCAARAGPASGHRRCCPPPRRCLLT